MEGGKLDRGGFVAATLQLQLGLGSKELRVMRQISKIDRNAKTKTKFMRLDFLFKRRRINLLFLLCFSTLTRLTVARMRTTFFVPLFRLSTKSWMSAATRTASVSASSYMH